MARVLVILPTEGYRTADFVRAAAELGVELVVASETSPPVDLGDRFVRIDCTDANAAADAIVDLATRTPIDAVVAADDLGVVPAAIAAERLGLDHVTPPAAAATRDKLVMRAALAGGEVPQPAWRRLRATDDPGTVDLAYPLVVKPVGLSAGRGVIRVDDGDRLTETVGRVRRILAEAGHPPDEDLLVEEFVPGPEVAVEGMVWDGELEVLAVFDKPDPLDGPYFEETLLVTPSRHPADLLAEVERVTAAALAALDLRQGPIHAELRLGDGRPRLIELAARTIGGACGRSLRFGLAATPLETLVLRQALGIRRHLARLPGASGVMMLPIPRAGRLLAVEGRRECLAVPGVEELELSVPIGGEVRPPPEGDRYLGFLFARGDTPDEVEAALRSGHAALHIEVG